MIIDTSAIVAILRDESGARDCALAIQLRKVLFVAFLLPILLKPHWLSTEAAIQLPAGASTIFQRGEH